MQTKLLPNIILIFLLLFLTDHTDGQGRPKLTVKVGDLICDDAEICVGSWLSFYSWVLENKGVEDAHKLLPDSTAIEPAVWQFISNKTNEFRHVRITQTEESLGFFNPTCKSSDFVVKDSYLPDSYDFPAYFQFLYGSNYIEFCPILMLPITGVSYEQVIDFCRWRTGERGGKKYEYRLPTPEEWKTLAHHNLSQTEKSKEAKDSIKNQLPTFSYKSNIQYGNKNYMGKLNIIGKFDASFKIFDVLSKSKTVMDIFGNVSEMTSVKGIAKGGNYQLYANQSHSDSTQYYQKPEKWLGFRCVLSKISQYDKNIDLTNLPINDTAKIENWDGKYGEITDSRDGRVYKVVKIGEQVWMKQNVIYKPPHVDFMVLWMNNMYTWEVAQDMCPCGWRLPTKEEALTLLDYYGGPKKKANAELSNYMMTTAFWTSTEKSKKDGWVLFVGSNHEWGEANIYKVPKKGKAAVRCIKQ